MKVAVLSFVLLLGIAGHAQNPLNSYKYVIVPLQFDFSKTVNQYGVNTTTKRLLEQKGFVVVFENETMPPAVIANRCNALKADVTEGKGFLQTKLTLLLKDCTGNTVFKTKEGKSREKDYAAAYDGAIKDAFTTLNNLDYKYDSTLVQQQQFAATPAVQSPASAPAAAPATTTPAESSPANAAPVTSSPAQATPPVTAPPANAANVGTLYAQPTVNGYQLVDTSPKKILTLLKTSVQDYFIAQAETTNGIVFKKNGEWYFEYYNADKLVSRKLEIKF